MSVDREGIQRLLTASGYYKGRIDGVWGTQTLSAAKTIVNRHRDKIADPKFGTQTWTSDRYIIAAAQLVLLYTGNQPGAIDGYWGHNTENAFENWDSVSKSGKPVVVDRDPAVPPKGATPVKPGFPRQKDCPTFYGTPGLPGSAAEKAMYARLVSIQLPFDFRIDYNLDQTVKTMKLHHKCAESAEQAYWKVYRHYGQAKMIELGLDRFAGAYNPRYMRGGTSFSMHAYGCAIDTYAGPNGLHVHRPKALFSKPDYDAWFDIWAEHGWTSLGRAIDRDYMHVQAASL